MGIFRKITGKNKLRKQYEQSRDESYAEEARIRGRLVAQQRDEHAKIAAQRSKLELLKQQESTRHSQEISLLSKLQADKEAAFQKACQKITDNMWLIRAALYACMIGNVEILEILLKRDNALRFIFFNLHPLHIAAEHN